MRFLFAGFQSALTVQISRKRVWLLFLLLLAAGAVRLLPGEEVSAPVQVGVVLPEEGGGDFWERLQARGGLVVTFLPASLEQAERQVGLGRWDCALVLPEDLSARLARGDREGLFTLLTGPGSTVYPLVRETASACAAECLSPGMAEDYLLDSGIFQEGEVEAVRPRLHEVLLDRDRVLVSMETLDGAPLDPIALADSGLSRLAAGVTAIFLLAWSLLAAMDLGRWLDSPFARRLIPLRGRLALLLPRLAGALIPALCAGALALLALERPLPYLLALVPYLLFCGAAALALARIRPLWEALPVLMPFVPAAGLLLSPVLLDLSVLFPALGPLSRWMPITLYLRACGGAWEDGLVLAAGGAVLLALLAAEDRWHTDRSPSMER